MKKFFLILMAVLFCGMAAMAVPAKPGWHQITQSDGSTLTVQAVGNAFNHALVTTDGLTVARGIDGDFYYMSSVTGLSGVRAHDASERSASEASYVAIQREALQMAVKDRRPVKRQDKFAVGGSNADSWVPANGSRRIPIILVEFQDKKFSNTREEIIESMLTGSESVGQYFRDQSNGLYEPEFEVFGIYTLSQNRQYYGGNSGGSDKGLGSMVTEACQKASAAGVSFGPYDTNGDDYCDVVIVIYAGVGEAQASWNHPEAIWPCNWDLNSAAYYNTGGNGEFRPAINDPLVNNFAVFNELHGSDDNGKTIDGIGTFAHEFGHCLGLPDFYDTGNGNHIGMADWDIMCMGCYNNDGFTPPGYSAYEKVFMGWIEYVEPRPGTYYTLPVFNQKNAATDKALCVKSDLNENEFFIFENRRRQGWDRYMPGNGIMVTHVTYNADRWSQNTPNNENIQLMTIVPADNNLSYNTESTDLWPQQNKTELTDNSTPATSLYMTANGNITGNAGYLGKPVTEMVINGDGTASFWYMKGAAVDPVISVSPTELDFGAVMMNDSKSLTFKVMGQALTGDVNVALNDVDGVFSINPTVISAADAANDPMVTVTFSPDAIRDYGATITLSSDGAQDVIVNLTGRGLIESYTPVMLPADEAAINLTKFRADWTDATPEQNVSSYTLEVNLKPNVALLETADFSTMPDVLDGEYLKDISTEYEQYLPAGWYGSSYLASYGGGLILAYEAILRTPAYNLKGYDKVTVVINGATYGGTSSTMRVSTSQGVQELTLSDSFTDYVVVLDCADDDAVTIADVESFVYVKQVQVYAGDLTTVSRADVPDDSTYRFITGITDKHFTVTGLQAEGTFQYKVKTVYSDGSESAWSNVEEVILHAGSHGFEVGDVNHDGKVNITDVTMMITAVTSNQGGICPICSDFNGDGNYNISDVIDIINFIVNGR